MNTLTLKQNIYLLFVNIILTDCIEFMKNMSIEL